MPVFPDGDGEPEEFPYVSTGHLPASELVATSVAEAHARYKSNTDGSNSEVYPALARVRSELFGVCVVGTDSSVYEVGDTNYEFTIMSVSKPFVFALVCQEIGAKQAREKLGANATGLPFDSLSAVERSADGRTNPMVNAGAIATTSLVPGTTSEVRRRFIHNGLTRFAGRNYRQLYSENEPPYAALNPGTITSFACPDR